MPFLLRVSPPPAFKSFFFLLLVKKINIWGEAGEKRQTNASLESSKESVLVTHAEGLPYEQALT